MIKFTDIAKGDEPGVDKINKNFDMVEQALNLEERKEIIVPLSSDWKLAHSGDNPLKIVVTQGGAWLSGDVQPKQAGTTSYGNTHPIAIIPGEITFRGATYSIDLDRSFLAPIGDRKNAGETTAVRIYLDGGGKLNVDEPQDFLNGGIITIDCYLDIKRK